MASSSRLPPFDEGGEEKGEPGIVTSRSVFATFPVEHLLVPPTGGRTDVTQQCSSLRERAGEVECRICFQVPWVPVVLRCDCRHVFCAPCIETWFESCPSGRCPTCNKEPEHPSMVSTVPLPDGELKRIHDALVLRCPHVGCVENVPMKHFAFHVDRECLSAVVLCSFCKDEPAGTRGHIHAHEAVCPANKARCRWEGCDRRVQVGSIKIHEDECLFRQVPCCACSGNGVDWRVNVFDFGRHLIQVHGVRSSHRRRCGACSLCSTMESIFRPKGHGENSRPPHPDPALRLNQRSFVSRVNPASLLTRTIGEETERHGKVVDVLFDPHSDRLVTLHARGVRMEWTETQHVRKNVLVRVPEGCERVVSMRLLCDKREMGAVMTTYHKESIRAENTLAFVRTPTGEYRTVVPFEFNPIVSTGCPTRRGRFLVVTWIESSKTCGTVTFSAHCVACDLLGAGGVLNTTKQALFTVDTQASPWSNPFVFKSLFDSPVTADANTRVVAMWWNRAIQVFRFNTDLDHDGHFGKGVDTESQPRLLSHLDIAVGEGVVLLMHVDSELDALFAVVRSHVGPGGGKLTFLIVDISLPNPFLGDGSTSRVPLDDSRVLERVRLPVNDHQDTFPRYGSTCHMAVSPLRVFEQGLKTFCGVRVLITVQPKKDSPCPPQVIELTVQTNMLSPKLSIRDGGGCNDGSVGGDGGGGGGGGGGHGIEWMGVEPV